MANSNETQIVVMQNTLDRILGHHDEFKDNFSSLNKNVAELIQVIHREKTERMSAIYAIKDELHGRINKILFSILGGAVLFIVGIVTFVFQQRLG
jgi:hypothetical protein